jgi:hypothetical protein
MLCRRALLERGRRRLRWLGNRWAPSPQKRRAVSYVICGMVRRMVATMDRLALWGDATSAHAVQSTASVATIPFASKERRRSCKDPMESEQCFQVSHLTCPAVHLILSISCFDMPAVPFPLFSFQQHRNHFSRAGIAWSHLAACFPLQNPLSEAGTRSGSRSFPGGQPRRGSLSGRALVTRGGTHVETASMTGLPSTCLPTFTLPPTPFGADVSFSPRQVYVEGCSGYPYQK